MSMPGGLADNLDLQVLEVGKAGWGVEEYREMTALTSAEVVEDLPQAGADVDAVVVAVAVDNFFRDPLMELAE